jgi:RNA polymerase sigma-70 factor, ECF subfamily
MHPHHGSRPYPPGPASQPAATPRSLPALPPAPAPRPARGSLGGGGGGGGTTIGAEVDPKLVRRMKANDENALGEFYDRWFPVVNCLATRMLKSPADVEEVVEETFWQAWRQADRFDPERGTVQSWLLTMARSRVLDRLRSTRRLREDSIDDSPNVEASTSAASPTDPSLAVEHAERKQLVLAALADLPREQREALELGYFGGLSQSDIAQRTGLPLGTIKTRMRLAMLKLRERLSALREDAR